jgi:acetyltransferase-like isoleucine patch superfamily enzyme
MEKSQNHNVTSGKYGFGWNPFKALKKLAYFLPIILPLPSGVSARIFRLYGVKIKNPDRLFIGYNVWLDSSAPSFIEIGEHVILGAGVKVIAHSAPTFLMKDQISSVRKPVLIEDGVLVGVNSVILPGLVIGKCSVIAAGSVVTQDVEPYSIVGGNPAKLLKKIEPEALEVD